MAFDFPSAPTVGQVANGYTWDGEKWTAPAGSSPTIYVSDTPPTGTVADNAMWWRSSEGALYVRYRDVDSVAWVQAAPGAADYAALQSYTDVAALNPSDNLLINSFMEFSEENGNNNISIPINAAKYICDQWLAYTNAPAGTFTGTRYGTGGPIEGIAKAVGLSSTGPFAPASTETCILQQSIEGARWSHLGWGLGAGSQAIPIAIGFWAFSNVGGNASLSIANGDSTRSYCALFNLPASAWVYRTIVVPGDVLGTWLTGAQAAVQIRFCWGCGAGVVAPAAGAWYAGNYTGAPGQSNHFNAASKSCIISAVTLMPGTVAVPQAQAPKFRRGITEEHNLCRRYYNKLAANYFVYYPNFPAAGHGFSVGLTWAPQMRSIPAASSPDVSVSNMAAPSFAPNYDGTQVFSTSLAAGVGTVSIPTLILNARF